LLKIYATAVFGVTLATGLATYFNEITFLADAMVVIGLTAVFTRAAGFSIGKAGTGAGAYS